MVCVNNSDYLGRRGSIQIEQVSRFTKLFLVTMPGTVIISSIGRSAAPGLSACIVSRHHQASTLACSLERTGSILPRFAVCHGYNSSALLRLRRAGYQILDVTNTHNEMKNMCVARRAASVLAYCTVQAADSVRR